MNLRGRCAILLLLLCTVPVAAGEMRGRGGSMVPLFHDGERLTVDEQFPYARLTAGLPVVRYRGGLFWPVCHLTVRKERGGWVTRGIANHNDDPDLMTRETYIGVAMSCREHRGLESSVADVRRASR